MRFGSVCSGIEAASVAWTPLGWEAAWFSEIEPFPCSVLSHHFPTVPNHGDMTTLPERIRSGEVEAPDVFCGGTPCQAFSVAGKRQSLDDARGNLSLIFCEVANAIDNVRHDRGEQPSIVFWENVPGVLNTKDNAFGCFLAGLAGEDEPLQPSGKRWPDAGCVLGPQRAVAWRVLDAQYFGLAQRRKRVFVVASARNGFDPAAVLFEFEGVRRDTAPSREAREEAAGGAGAGTANGGSGYGARSGDSKDELIACYAPDLAATMVARSSRGGGQTNSPGYQADKELVVTHSLRGEGFDASEDGTGRGAPLAPVAISFGAQMSVPQVDFDLNQTLQAKNPMAVAFVQNTRDEVRLMGGDGSIVGALAAETGAKQQCYVMQAVAFSQNQLGEVRAGDVFNTINTNSNASGRNTPMVAMGVEAYPLDLRNALRDPEKYDDQNRQGVGTGEDGDPAPTLTKAHVHGVAFVQNTRDEMQAFDILGTPATNGAKATDIHVPLRARAPGASEASTTTVLVSPAVKQPISWSEELTASVDVAGTIQRGGDGGRHDGVMTAAMQVRRLTPRECERLQGFPDDYTLVPNRGKPAADGPRYKALGNSWAVPVVRWIGQRIEYCLAGIL